MKDKLKIFGILTLLMVSIYFIATYLRVGEINNIQQINKNFKITTGVVIKKSVQKGNHIWIRYNVNGNIYVESDGFLESQKVNVGDIIKVKYSIDKPELMITEFNEYF
ncbi:hypothetical protein [Chryseobacterium flavum]|uniref:hypothetical protein n=1 Tax=Chryseobacterium flavum TaxID=415851 RepID=UPI0028AAF9AD|nr:hypothetical protein [Chryseobacterium flavum]